MSLTHCNTVMNALRNWCCQLEVIKMPYEIKANVSKKQRLIVIYCPQDDELKEVEKAVKEALEKLQV